MYPVYKDIGKREECEEVNLTFPVLNIKVNNQDSEYLMQPRPISENPYRNIKSEVKR